MTNVKTVIFITVLLPIMLYANIIKAYSYYMLKEYDSSIVYYEAAHKADTNALDPFLGLINCYTALKQYDKALSIAKKALTKQNDFFLLQKTAYLYGLKNEVSQAADIYEKSKKFPQAYNEEKKPSIPHADFINSVGYGLYYAGNYRQALGWFEKGDSLFPLSDNFAHLVSLAKKAKKNVFREHVNIYGGYISFSDDILYNIDYPYAYDNADYYGVKAALLHRFVHKFNIGYSHLNIQLKKLYKGKRYLDTLYSSKGEHPDNNVLYDSIVFGPETVYLIFEESIAENINENLFNSIIVYNPNDLWEDDYYIAYTDYYSLFKKTKLTIGMRFTQSNMLNTREALTVIAGHESSIKKMSLGSFYYFTNLDNYRLFQGSPKIIVFWEHFEVDIALNIIKAYKLNTSASGISLNVQTSFDLGTKVKIPYLQMSLSTSIGKNSFANMAEGQILHNVSNPHKVSEKLILELSPFKLSLTFYYLFQLSHYYDYNKLTNMGGVFYQW